MDLDQAVLALSALAQETRLAVFRLLVKEGPGGLPAGEVADRLRVTPATLSFHLAQLERARLLSSQRHSRQIVYRVDLDGTRRLLAFLTEDCCQGRPELCAGLGTDAPADPDTGTVPTL
ncbi:MAG: metalloregulator ArsR/SmtB family transcription factor [Kiloniellales bacterium]|jgi:DNA-binding transcriptional ArsR family regulator